MGTFRILCFSGNVLIDWKEHRAADIVECLSALSALDFPRIEVWSGSKRVAVLKAAGSPVKERLVPPPKARCR